MVVHLPSMCEGLGSIPNIENTTPYYLYRSRTKRLICVSKIKTKTNINQILHRYLVFS
jgi:hypothetical protein